MPLNITRSVATQKYEGIQATYKKNKPNPTFKSELAATIASRKPEAMPSAMPPSKISSAGDGASLKLATSHLPNITKAHQQQPLETNRLSGWETYKEDQLLSNPGGDRYDLQQNKIMTVSEKPTSFLERIGKDFSDGFSNLINGVKNIFMGADRSYRDADGQIKTVKRDGIFRALGRCLKNIGSALTFGQWHPDEEKAPEGFVERAKFTFSKIRHALMGDLLQGVGGGTLQVGEDLVLAGLNLVEILPDATIGNVDAGEKLTTAIFDNGQVIVDYLTDILPTGEAWLRVHALSLKDRNPPIFYNLSLPENYEGDARWQTVRNTPFRKTIETIGALLADIVTVRLISNSHGSSQGRKKEAGY